MRILIVDDEEVLQDVLTSLLRQAGYETLSARTAKEARSILANEEIDLVLLDLMLPDGSGLDLLKDIREKDPEQVVIVITAFSSVEGAIQAMRDGAFHYIPKPFKNEEVLLTVEHGLDQRRLAQENRNLRAQLRQRYGFDNIIGKSKPMEQVFELIQLAAPAKSNILVLGESGTGKELVAKAIHHNSRRSKGPFVTVNSGSMPRICSRAPSSVTSRALSPERIRTKRACSSWPTRGRSSSTKSATFLSTRNRSSCE